MQDIMHNAHKHVKPSRTQKPGQRLNATFCSG